MSRTERRTAAIRAWNRYWLDRDLEALLATLTSIRGGH
jgi:hypothetical protein